jgi:hypothetical protein
VCSSDLGPAINAGILINDVAIDADNGDAYFSDSPNCREDSAAHRLRSDQCF